MPEPKVTWLPPKAASLRWPVGGPIFAVLFAAQCAIRIFLAARQNGDPIVILIVESLTDPLMYLWGVLAIAGLQTIEGQPLRCKCPHCGDEWEPSQNLRKAPLGDQFRCTECKNTFVKKTAPP